MMTDVVFDLDDLAMGDRDCILDLLTIKEMYPKFVCTLFAIPFYKNQDQSSFLQGIINDFPWIEIAIHGWKHDTNFESSKWTKQQAINYIQQARKMGCFVDGFKAPGWQISRGTYEACKHLDIWVADHKISIYTEDIPNEFRRPRGLKFYEIDHPWMVHGHTWECENNGIKTLIERGFDWDQNTNFHFISEIV